MTKEGRNYRRAVVVSADTPVNIEVCNESPDEFAKRVAYVQTMIIEIILLARKRGRPSRLEEKNAEAA